MTALVCAIAIHILVIEVSDSQHWFERDAQPSTFELLLLPAPQTTQTSPNNDPPKAEAETFAPKEEAKTEEALQADATLATEMVQPDNAEQIETLQPTEPPTAIESEGLTGKELSERSNEFDPQEVINNIDNEQAFSENPLQNDRQDSSSIPTQLSTDKPDLLDLSKISLSPDVKDESLVKVFSKELRDKISDSKKAQKEYLQGLKKEDEEYPVTKDADGTRYVNIKGVCWRLPKEGSKEGWAIVFDGCGVKSKLFHFELNISPSIITNELLSPNSPFNLDQPAK